MASPRTGTSTGEVDTISVSIDVLALWLGTHHGKIKVEAPNADQSPQYVNVYATIVKPPHPYKPENAQHERFDNIGLFIQNYVNVVTWQKTWRNDNLFNIVKFRIYRKNKGEPDSSFDFLAEVPVSSGWEYHDNCDSREKRDNYVYGISEVDDQNVEGHKAVSELKKK